jgi:hypothetical protein
MPTRRTPLRRSLLRKINPAAIEAWKVADYLALHRALRLSPGDMSPLPETITALGCSEENPPNPDWKPRPWDKSYTQAIELQREFLELAGWPDCRAAYEEKLQAAREMVEYYSTPPTHQGTGTDPESWKAGLEDALEELAWREQLLAEMPAPGSQLRPPSS